MSDLAKRAIKEELLLQLKTKPLSKITVKSITDGCDLSRNTFYYHFTDIPSLLEEIFVEATDHIIRENAHAGSLELLLRHTVNYALEYRAQVLHIYHSVAREAFEQYLWKVVRHAVDTCIDTFYIGQPLTPEHRAFLHHLYSCECVGQILDWLNHDMNPDITQSLQQIVQAHRLLINSVEGR